MVWQKCQAFFDVFCYKCRLYQISKLTIWFIFGVAIQYTKGDGKMEQYKLWCEKIEQQIKQNNKKIVLVAGASSSGKSYSSQVLCDYLCQNGIKARVYSADNYYKGVSRIITEKALQKNQQ